MRNLTSKELQLSLMRSTQELQYNSDRNGLPTHTMEGMLQSIFIGARIHNQNSTNYSERALQRRKQDINQKPTVKQPASGNARDKAGNKKQTFSDRGTPISESAYSYVQKAPQRQNAQGNARAKAANKKRTVLDRGTPMSESGNSYVQKAPQQLHQDTRSY